MDALAFLDEVIWAMPPSADNAADVQVSVARALRLYGYEARLEYPVEYDGRAGRIDIVAWRNGKMFAIEIDARKPRKKSIKKLLNTDADYRIVMLRGVGAADKEVPQGIDAIIPVAVHLESNFNVRQKVSEFAA